MKKILLMLLMISSNLAYAQWGIHSIVPGVNTAYANPDPGTAVRYVPPTTITRTNNPVAAAQWHFAGQQTAANCSTCENAGGSSWDWIYSIVATRNNESIACGFGNNGLGNFSGTIFKLDHLGNLNWSKAIDPTTMYIRQYDYNTGSPAVITPESSIAKGGALWSITKSNDGGYIAVGRGNGIFIVEVDSAGNFINGTPIDLLPPEYPTYGPSLTYPVADAYSVAIDPITNSAKNIIVGGVVKDAGSGFSGAFIMQLNYGSVIGPPIWNLGNVYYGGDGGHTGDGSIGSSINKILTQSTGAYTYNIYACGEVSATTSGGPTAVDNTPITTDNADGSITFDTYNKDIWLLKMDNTMASVSSQQYNKGNITVAGGTDLTHLSSYYYLETGPLTARNCSGPGYTPIAWWNPATSSNVYSEATEYLNFTNNYNEAAYDMVFTSDNKIAVITLVNLIGSNPKNIGYTARNVVRNASNGSAAPNYGEYLDGDAFLLKINPGDLSLVGAKNVGHFSGTNFFMQVKQRTGKETTLYPGQRQISIVHLTITYLLTLIRPAATTGLSLFLQIIHLTAHRTLQIYGEEAFLLKTIMPPPTQGQADQTICGTI